MEIQSTPIVPIREPLFEERGVELWLKREDLNHPLASGNKCRKLKYNLLEAKKQGFRKLLTFGGAYSNHIYAVAGVGQAEGFETIGVIRGEEHVELNPTLSFAQSMGMRLHYMDRSNYREKESEAVINLLKQVYGDFYLIPEGGTNTLALKGCAELAREIDTHHDYLCCPVGTGGTLAGLIMGVKGQCKVLGFSALKGDFLTTDVAGLLGKEGKNTECWNINTDYHFGGYAKVKPELMDFMTHFEDKHQILLDPVYTAKMMYGLYDLIEKDFFEKGSRIVAIHTGGLQGRAGFNMSNY